jgi:glycosyltransferase involved in cell wall biosynthesis
MPGFVQNGLLPKFYSSATVFLQVSLAETWGLAVNEAMASGLPVLVSRACGCVPDLVSDGLNGCVVDGEDISAISNAMIYLSRNPNKLAAMSRSSLDRISVWSLERFARNLVSACEVASKTAESDRHVSLLDTLILRALSLT